MDEQHLTDEYLARFPSTLRTALSEHKLYNQPPFKRKSLEINAVSVNEDKVEEVMTLFKVEPIDGNVNEV